IIKLAVLRHPLFKIPHRNLEKPRALVSHGALFELRLCGIERRFAEERASRQDVYNGFAPRSVFDAAELDAPARYHIERVSRIIRAVDEAASAVVNCKGFCGEASQQIF